MKPRYRSIETTAVHSTGLAKKIEGALVTPVFMSSTFEYGGQERYEDVRYIRLNNTPNHHVLNAKLSALEGGEAALVTVSGMSAITAALLSLLRSGDHILVQDGLYGGTHGLLVKEFPRLGIEFDFIRGDDPDSWESLLKPRTRAIYMESITNPLVQIGSLLSAVDFAREHGLKSVIDNTFASPVNLRPIEHGFDVVLHSGTKYLNGHSDIVAGVVVGSKEFVDEVTVRQAHLGGSLDPHACFLLERGLKTLALRVRQQNQSAAAIAEYLAKHPRISAVNYPGLDPSQGADGSREKFEGFGGMLSFEVGGGVDTARQFLGKLEIPMEAPSLGGVESLVTRPVTTSHAGVDPKERLKQGISDSLIRMSVGIESPLDLIDDLAQALEP